MTDDQYCVLQVLYQLEEDRLQTAQYDIWTTPADIAAVRNQAWSARGTPEGFDLVVWADLEREPGDVDLVAPAYVAAGATWWIESASPGPGWQAEAASRVSRGL